jgi:hypothetical protein
VGRYRGTCRRLATGLSPRSEEPGGIAAALNACNRAAEARSRPPPWAPRAALRDAPSLGWAAWCGGGFPGERREGKQTAGSGAHGTGRGCPPLAHRRGSPTWPRSKVPTTVTRHLSGGRNAASGRTPAHDSYLVDSASSHMLVSKIKPCMSKYKQLYSETANGSLYKLSFI